MNEPVGRFSGISSTTFADPVAQGLDSLSAALDEFAAAPLAMRAPAGQVDAVERLEELRRRLEFLSLGAIRELDASGARAVIGAPSVKTLLQRRVRLSAAEAGARVRAAEALCDGRTITGENLPPELPEVAAAAETGAISAQHVQVILTTMHNLSQKLPAETRAKVEQTMTDYALRFGPEDLARIGRRILLRVNPEKPDTEESQRRRGLSFRDDLPGTVAVRGILPAEDAALIQSALDPLAKPRPAVEGIKDTRTYPQRMADALTELAHKALMNGNLPTQGGVRPHLNITLRAQKLTTAREGRQDSEFAPGEQRSDEPANQNPADRTEEPATAANQNPAAEMPWVGPVPLDSIRWMLCDCAITFIERDENGVPIRISTPQRTIPLWPRRTIFARDGGCTFPGCDQPVGWSDIHHVTPWEVDPEHQMDNLVTLCGHQHRLIHREKWDIEFINRIPHFRPPRWIDPQQVPRRNHLHRTLPLRM